MNRRSLIQSVGGTAMLSALAGDAAQAQAPGRKTRIYRLEYLYQRQGEQGNRVNRFLTSQMPLLTKNIPTVGVFTTLLGPHMPYTLVLHGFTGLEEMEAADERIRKDSGYQAAVEEMEKGAEPPYDSAQHVLLRAFDFSPEITPLAEKPKTPRVFELRVYHSPTERQFRLLRERFSGAEVAIFHRSGVLRSCMARRSWARKCPTSPTSCRSPAWPSERRRGTPSGLTRNG